MSEELEHSQVMAGEMLVLSYHQLPQGFALNLGDPLVPPTRPNPAATLALLRRRKSGLEVLLLQRSQETRFIPGAWVFPGGRLSPEDEHPELINRLRGLGKTNAPRGPGPNGGDPASPGPGGADRPGAAFWSAAFRETFEETGILLHASPRSPRPGRLTAGAAGKETRLRVQQGELGFGQLLEGLDVDLNTEALAYIGHWVTPATEPIRFDTRFFATEVPEGCPVYPDGTELVDALWLSPAQALAQNRRGELPMAFPTLVTLKELQTFDTPSAALQTLGTRPIPRLLPRLVKAPDGVRFLLGD
jgi:8-oxo-dGTP pyrophosphatase MutT (NUDIX family)